VPKYDINHVFTIYYTPVIFDSIGTIVDGKGVVVVVVVVWEPVVAVTIYK
jgi:hypothetical protein